MIESKHTPGTWSYQQGLDARQDIVAGGEKVYVASTDGYHSRAMHLANAAFIVLAVNSHAELLKAARRTEERLTRAIQDGDTTRIIPARNCLRAAIAKATGEGS